MKVFFSKKILVLMLSVVLIMSSLSVAAIADESNSPQETTTTQAIEETQVAEDVSTEAPVVSTEAQTPEMAFEQTTTFAVPEETTAAMPASEKATAAEETTAAKQEETTTARQEETTTEAEIKYPAINGANTIGGVTVSFSAPEGSLPEGTTVKIAPVKDQGIFAAVEMEMERQGKNLADAVAFDITPYDKDGNEVQPLIPVTVTFVNTALDVDASEWRWKRPEYAGQSLCVGIWDIYHTPGKHLVFHLAY